MTSYQGTTRGLSDWEGPLVVVAIVTSHLGVLAGRRHDGKPPWTFPGGKVERGESMQQAAEREVREEVGLHVQGGGEIGRRIHPATGRVVTYLNCLWELDPEDARSRAGSGLTEVRWLSLAEMCSLMPDVYLPVYEHLERLIA